MTTTLTTAPVPFEDILDELEALAREHLLAYRVQLGHVMLNHFWGGDARAFSSNDATKDARFELFFSRCGDQLARYGLSQRQVRDSIRAAIVFDQLPPEVAGRLFLSQVLALTRLRDPTARVQVAVAALENDWSVQQLRDAVELARSGGDVDRSALAAAVDAAGAVDDAAAAISDPPPAPGRLVGRAEKLVEEVQRWRGHWAAVEHGKLRDVQRVRLAAALSALRAEVAGLEGLLGEDQ